MKKYIVILMLVPCSLLTGCASILNGTHQNVMVTTPPTTGAHCSLQNSKGKWLIQSTPATVKVHRDRKSLSIRCYKRGYYRGTRVVDSALKGAIAGNVIAGGFIGAGVDAADGAAYGYPATIPVPMRRRR